MSEIDQLRALLVRYLVLPYPCKRPYDKDELAEHERLRIDTLEALAVGPRC